MTTLADLIKPISFDGSTDDALKEVDDLDDEERKILQDAGILSQSHSMEKGKGKMPKHIVFVDDEAEGKVSSMNANVTNSCYLVARQYCSRRKADKNTDADIFIGEANLDLGWAAPKSARKKRKPKTNFEELVDGAEISASEQKVLAAVSSNHSLQDTWIDQVYVVSKTVPDCSESSQHDLLEIPNYDMQNVNSKCRGHSWARERGRSCEV